MVVHDVPLQPIITGPLGQILIEGNGEQFLELVGKGGNDFGDLAKLCAWISALVRWEDVTNTEVYKVSLFCGTAKSVAVAVSCNTVAYSNLLPTDSKHSNESQPQGALPPPYLKVPYRHTRATVTVTVPQPQLTHFHRVHATTHGVSPQIIAQIVSLGHWLSSCG